MRPPRLPEDPPDLPIQYIREGGGGWSVWLVIVLLGLCVVVALCSCTTDFSSYHEDTMEDTGGDTSMEADQSDSDTDSLELPEDTEDDDGGDVDAEEDTEGDIPEDTVDAEDAEEEEEPDPCEYYPTWYRDMDMDGYGRDSETVCFPTQPEGYAAEGGDCCDGRPEVNPGVTEWQDEPYNCPEESWDWNCDGVTDIRWPESSPGAWDDCHLIDNEEECLSMIWWDDTPPACGESLSGDYCIWSSAVGGGCGSASGAPTQVCM